MLVKVREAAKYVSLSPFTLIRWAKAGFIPATNPRGRSWLFDPLEVEKAIKAMGNSRLDKDRRPPPKGGQHVLQTNK